MRCRSFLPLVGQLFLLSGKMRAGLGCGSNRILLPNWVGVFEGGGQFAHSQDQNKQDGKEEDIIPINVSKGKQEDEDVRLNVIDDVQKIKKSKMGTENRINFWRQVGNFKKAELSSAP